MPVFNVSLAEMVFSISALYPSTKAFFEQYITDESPEFYVILKPKDIEYEREQSVIQNKKEEFPERKFSDNYLETLAVLRKVADIAFNHGVVLFHGSVVAVEGKAYLFAAPSGTGKTTHTKLWLDLIPGSYVLNGDKPFLKINSGHVLACGTPWRGKERYGCNEILPLEAICFLERDSENSITPMVLNQALQVLMSQIYLPNDTSSILKVLSMCKKIGNATRLYRLKCNMDPDAAVVSSSAMLV